LARVPREVRDSGPSAIVGMNLWEKSPRPVSKRALARHWNSALWAGGIFQILAPTEFPEIPHLGSAALHQAQKSNKSPRFNTRRLRELNVNELQRRVWLSGLVQKKKKPVRQTHSVTRPTGVQLWSPQPIGPMRNPAPSGKRRPTRKSGMASNEDSPFPPLFRCQRNLLAFHHPPVIRDVV